MVNSTQKPVEAYRWINRHFNPTGDKLNILSLCDGTGSAVVAAVADGHNAVGVESLATMHHFARVRLGEYTAVEGLRVKMVTAEHDEQLEAAVQFCRSFTPELVGVETPKVDFHNVVFKLDQVRGEEEGVEEAGQPEASAVPPAPSAAAGGRFLAQRQNDLTPEHQR